MRTESLRRVYCDADGCNGREEMWLPYTTDEIRYRLNAHGWTVETIEQRSATMGEHHRVGRVLCPDCAKEL